MSVRIIVVALASTLLAHNALAKDDGIWVNITESSKTLWQGKNGSGHITTVDGKKNNGYAYIYQLKNKQTGNYEYGQAVVLLESCKKGYGYVFYNDMNGKYTDNNLFVRFGPTVADDIGSMACTSWDNETGKSSKENIDDAWELVATSKQSGDEYHFKKDTVRKRSYNGSPAISTLTRVHDVSRNTFDYSESVITVADCKKQFGILYDLSFDGKLNNKLDIALHGNSVASILAGDLCDRL